MQKYKIILIGIITGILSGLLGVGGGIIMTPAMVLLLNTSQHKAHGTSLFVITWTAIIGVFVYWIRGSIEVNYVFLLVFGSISGAIIGSSFAAKMSERTLRLSYCGFLIFVGFRMIMG